MARKKADELEDFGNKSKDLPEVSPEVADEAIDVVYKVLQDWVSSQDGEDVVMGDASADQSQDLASLREALERYKPQIEGNEWLQQMLQAF